VALTASEVWWSHAGTARFTDPFFEDTFARVAPAERRWARTPHSALDAADALDAAVPTALLFHASRCGSTLLAQLLATRREAIVLAEPPVLDDWVAHYREADAATANRALIRLLRLLGRRRSGDERELFVKLDSWHVAHLPLFRRALPRTPFFFLYRRPAAILASHRRQPGRQMVPGLVDPARLGLQPEAVTDWKGYPARVLTSLFAAALRHARAGALKLLAYDDLPASAWTILLPACGVTPAPEEVERMRARAAWDAKARHVPFSPPSEVPPEPLPDALPSAYEALERLRLRA